MILRSPTKHENGVIPLHMVVLSSRHSRARGNPGSCARELTWIPAFAGMTEPGSSWPAGAGKLNPRSSFRRRIFEGRTEFAEIIFFNLLLGVLCASALKVVADQPGADPR